MDEEGKCLKLLTKKFRLAESNLLPLLFPEKKTIMSVSVVEPNLANEKTYDIIHPVAAERFYCSVSSINRIWLSATYLKHTPL